MDRTGKGMPGPGKAALRYGTDRRGYARKGVWRGSHRRGNTTERKAVQTYSRPEDHGHERKGSWKGLRSPVRKDKDTGSCREPAA